ncbi:Cathepsin_B [Hexamita inflata]|uniref:Cathepsin B n=1 Tax=Hexamita inflata TaxID=28002 RepID=A0AA86QRR3_9EUKA|nr:Cathepsin B [Hexamita inflata]
MFGILTLASPFFSEETLKHIKNIPGKTWRAAIPKNFAHLTRDEMKAKLMPAPQLPKTMEFATSEPNTAIPDAFDFRTAFPKCVGEIRDQQKCGSCWAFSAVGAFSDRRCTAGLDTERVQYSEEYVVACDTHDKGCQGGSILYVHMFLKKTGTPTLKCISYKSGDGNTKSCPTKCDDGSDITLTKTKSYRIIEMNTTLMMEEIQKGPIQGQFFVYEDFTYYEGGIYQHEYGEMLGGHAIITMGWGEENGVPYWIIRNSWGPEWGEHGYFRIIRGTNECIIETAAACVEVK